MAWNAAQDIITLSGQKWEWMSQRQTKALAALFHEDAVFVHMGATMTKEQELQVIDSGQIHYKDIALQETGCARRCRAVSAIPEQASPCAVTQVAARPQIPTSPLDERLDVEICWRSEHVFPHPSQQP